MWVMRGTCRKGRGGEFQVKDLPGAHMTVFGAHPLMFTQPRGRGALRTLWDSGPTPTHMGTG